MKLKVLLPTEVLIEEEVAQVTAEGENGFFCLKTRHVDFVSALVPGLLSYVNAAGEEVFMAVGEGVLVKCGTDVLVSTAQAVAGPDLGSLKDTVEKRFRQLDDKERSSRTAVAKLEANFVRKFLELGKEV
jgi:F-type H+-transporting ATPase subunit epsilon